MEESFLSIGIDVSKTALDIYGLGKASPAQVTNDSDGIEKLMGWLQKPPPE